MRFTDQLNNTIELSDFPKRIISIVPSQSELLWDLGIRKELIGITKFCIHPKKMFSTTERVGGTKKLNIEKIRSLNPDIIIGNKEENEHTQILELQKEFNVWMSDIYTLEDALKSIREIGILVNKENEANSIADNIDNSFRQLEKKQKSVLYLIWRKPYMAAGKATFIGDILNKAGFHNVLTDEHSRYPELTLEKIRKLNPEFIFLSSEPYPFKEVHINELQKDLPHSKICLVDGELFSWYGTRLLQSVDYLNQLIKQLN